MPINFDPSFWKDSWSHRKGLEGELKGTILAAGLGSRMSPLTAHHLPKPLFPLGGKVPMAELWVRRFVRSGITNVSMNLCVLSESIKRHFRDGTKFAANISYVDEDKPSGTLGGVCKQALGTDAKTVMPGEQSPMATAFKGSTIIAPSGDIVTNFGAEQLEEMYQFHQKQGAAFTIALVPVPWERRKDYGTVVLEWSEEQAGTLSKFGQISQFREKDPDSPSNLNNASIYMIEMELLKTLDSMRTEVGVDVSEPFYDFGKHVFPAMLGELAYATLPRDFSLWGIEYDGCWYDVGQKRDYLRVNEHLLDGKLDVELPYERLPWGYLGTDVTIDYSRVTLVPPVVIGNGCVIEGGATLGPYAIIGDGWVIEDGATIRNSVLWQRYAYFGGVADGDGVERTAGGREPADQRQIRSGVTIEESILVGGTIDEDVRGKTVDVREDGTLGILPIDHVPKGPRA